MNRRSFFLNSSALLIGAPTVAQFAAAETPVYDPEKVIADLGLAVPDYGPSQALFERYTEAGNLIFLSGTIPFVDGERVHPGVVGDSVTLEQAQEAAQRCIIQLLGVMRLALGGDWNKLDQVMRIEGYVRSSDDFGDQPRVMNAASELVRTVLGDRGRHTRTAIGVKELPFQSCVEVAGIIAVKA